MTLTDLSLASLESALNHCISLDPYAQPKLAAFHGQVIAIHLRGPEITLYLIPDEVGGLQILRKIDGKPDCTLSGSPLDLLKSADDRQGARQLFAGHLVMEGNTELAHRFGEILGGLDIDWEEQLSKLTGDIVAHRIGQSARSAASYLQGREQRIRENLSEYLTEEARLLPSTYELEDFANQVDQLRDDTERLSARILRLTTKTSPAASQDQADDPD